MANKSIGLSSRREDRPWLLEALLLFFTHSPAKNTFAQRTVTAMKWRRLLLNISPEMTENDETESKAETLERCKLL